MIRVIIFSSLIAAAVIAAPTVENNAEVESPADVVAKMNQSSFTCFGREMGYYADVDRHCRVYFFCNSAEYFGETIYKRETFLCLNETVFDQQHLDCVAANQSTTPCEESPKHYEASNHHLREAIADKSSIDRQSTATPSATSAAPSS